MAHRRPMLDLHSKDSTLTVVNKTPKPNGCNIKDKISLWEGKEPTHSSSTSSSLSHCGSVKRKESLTKSQDEQSAGRDRAAANEEKENQGRESSGSRQDSRSCSPLESGNQQRGRQIQKVEDEVMVKHDREKENEERLRLTGSCSVTVTVQQQVGMLKKSSERRKGEQNSQETRAVFSLFKKLEAMGENQGKILPELGNYFSPPTKDKSTELKKKIPEIKSETQRVKPELKQDQDNVYTEPGTLPINPVPKPRRTFQHPSKIPTGKSQKPGRGQRNLPPLPSSLWKGSSKPPSGVYGRLGGERARDNINRY